MEHKRWKYPLLALAFTCLAVPLVWLLALNPFEHEADFALSDFYERAELRQKSISASDDVVLVAVDNLNREEIIQVTKAVSDAGAAVTVLDVFMTIPQEGDAALRELLRGCPSLVLPYALGEDASSYIYADVPASWGYADISTPSSSEVIRWAQVRQGCALSLAGAAASAYKEDVSLPGDEFLIQFSGRDFDELTPDILAEDPACVEGKIVIVGCVNDFSDVHTTPVGQMSGAYIHAYTLQTLLDGSAKREVSLLWSWCIACILCYFLFLGYLYINEGMGEDNVASFLMRLAQLALLVGIYLLGSVLFIRNGCYWDFSPILLMVGAEALLIDCVLGIPALLRFFKKHCSR